MFVISTRVASRLSAGVCTAALLWASGTARANINLEWRPDQQSVEIGDEVRITLYAVSDSREDQHLAAMDVIFAWDPEHLRLLGIDNEGGPDVSFSGFLEDPFFLNEVIPPQDGNGLYTLWGKPGQTVVATPDGTLITTFRFEALAPTPETVVDIPLEARVPPHPPARTKVFDGFVPNRDVTGELGSASVAIGGGQCSGNERVKRPSCKEKNGRNLLVVKLAGGAPGDFYEAVLSSGARRSGNLNDSGKAKVKFKKVESGADVVSVTWGCGAEARRPYSCP